MSGVGVVCSRAGNTRDLGPNRVLQVETPMCYLGGVREPHILNPKLVHVNRDWDRYH